MTHSQESRKQKQYLHSKSIFTIFVVTMDNIKYRKILKRISLQHFRGEKEESKCKTRTSLEEVRDLLYSLVDYFKGIGSSMHVNKVKALICLYIIISCKTKSHHKKQVVSVHSNSILYIFCSSANAINSIRLIHLNDKSHSVVSPV